MQDKRYIICGNAPTSGIEENPERDLRLRLWGKDGPDKITLRIEDIHKKMSKDVPDSFQDLLEIATYVYCADQAIPRGADDVDSFGHGWRRNLHFIIPVRNPDFWNGEEIQQALCSTLGFLSDDSYHFEFTKLKDAQAFQGYLDFNDDGRLHGYPEQVVMFSGGLDSLAGAIDEVLNEKHRVVLVTHKPTPKLNKRHRRLEKMIADKAGENTPLHIGVRVNKNKKLNKEYTQRSRSFLYVSIGATIAKMLNLNSVRFYENGVISLNLPVCAQVVGGRATRTTHPRVFRGFQEIISLVAGEPFTIENPYIWKTKAEVVEVITKAGCQDMIAASTTCTHTWEMTNDHTHCGTCSQCIDRRFAVIAAKADQYDPVEAYKADIFTQSRSKDEDKIMAAAYLERANQVRDLDCITQFIAQFSEVSRVFRYLDGNPGSAAQKVYDLYKRHATEVCDAMKTMIARNITAILQRTLPGDCLLRTMYESGSVISVPAIELTIEQPANYFRRRGDVWEVRFNKGQPIKLVTANKGSQYLSYLLSHPNQPIPVAELVCGSFYDPSSGIFSAAEIDGDDIEDGYQITQGIPLTDAGVIIDAKAREQYRERISELLQDIDEARDTGNKEKEEELRDEMTVIACALNGSKARGGKPRTLGDKRKNVKDSFRIAVKRAIEKLSEYDSPLGQHLDSSIKFGNEPVYLTEEEIVWEVRPIVNE
jgi:7-cyano-7-deazaguanine synthase in queuosine biosynthesis